MLEFQDSIGRVSTDATVKTQPFKDIAFIDQHGTYQEARTGKPAHHRKGITEYDAKMLLDPSENWEMLARTRVKTFEGLKTDLGFPPIPFNKLARYAVRNFLKYKTRHDQERALANIAREGLASCTVLSGIKAEDYKEAWYKLGRVGREAVDKDRQMILRLGDHAMLSKLLGIGWYVHGFDLPAEIRQERSRAIYVVDDDPTFNEIASSLYDITCLSPITEQQVKNYPKLLLPPSVKKRSDHGEIIFGTGLPELHGILMALHGRARISAPQAVKLIMKDSIPVQAKLPLLR